MPTGQPGQFPATADSGSLCLEIPRRSCTCTSQGRDDLLEFFVLRFCSRLVLPAANKSLNSPPADSPNQFAQIVIFEACDAILAGQASFAGRPGVSSPFILSAHAQLLVYVPKMLSSPVDAKLNMTLVDLLSVTSAPRRCRGRRRCPGR